MDVEQTSSLVRVAVDAVAGAGMVLRHGDLLSPDRLGEYFEPLLQSGALVWVSDSERDTSAS